MKKMNRNFWDIHFGECGAVRFNGPWRAALRFARRNKATKLTKVWFGGRKHFSHMK